MNPTPDLDGSPPRKAGGAARDGQRVARRITDRALLARRVVKGAAAGRAAAPTRRALKGKRSAPAESTGPAAALEFISSGGYEAASQLHVDKLQQVLSGLSEPQLDLAPLQALLVSLPAGWTLNQSLQSKAWDLVTAATDAEGAEALQQLSCGTSLGAEELQTKLDEANADVGKVAGLSLPQDVMRMLQNKADALARELQTRRQLDQRAAAFACEQAACLSEVRELLGGEIDLLKKVQQHVVLHRISVGQSRLFLLQS